MSITGSAILQSRIVRQARLLQKSLILGASLLTFVPATIAAPPIRQIPAIATASIGASSNQANPLKNGTYLYGEAAKANQLGSAYLVFEVRNSQISGAVYWPGSSFECLSGQAQADRLSLTFRRPDPDGANSRDIALTRNDTIASNANVAAPVGLEGMHPIPALTGNDRRILTACQALK